MGVYFALRTHYDFPTGKYLRYFPEDESVLAWFQRHWQGKSREKDEEKGYVREILGCEVYGFATLFEAIAEHNLARPQTMRQLVALLNEHLYVEGEILSTNRVIQVLTDDDELELAYYFFDDAYVKKEPGKASYLLWEDWRLPEGAETSSVGALPSLPSGVNVLPKVKNGAGTVYAAFLSYYDSGNLVDLNGAYRVPGVRLPGLLSYLQSYQPDEYGTIELSVLRALGSSTDTLNAVLEDVKSLPICSIGDDLYRLKFGTGTPEKDLTTLRKAVAKVQADDALRGGKQSLVQCEEHVAQLCLHSETWSTDSDSTLLFQRWIFFDDLWLQTYPDLGKAILRFGTRWDVLT